MKTVLNTTSDLRALLNAVPKCKRFPTYRELAAATSALKGKSGFRVKNVGKSAHGYPIQCVKWGNGKTKALIVGFPHPNEPIGALSVLTLFHLFQKHPKAMMPDHIEWNIIPCIDPEGMILNEGWSKKDFSFKAYMENYFRQNSSEQVEWSFPIAYKKLRFNKPSVENRVLMKVMNEIVPDFYMPLHNFLAGGVYFYLGGLHQRRYIPKLKNLVANLGLNLHVGEDEAPFVETLEQSFFGEVSIRAQYDYFAKFDSNPQKRIAGGASSFDYLSELNPRARTLIVELPYVQCAKSTSKASSGILKRHLAIKQELSKKLTQSLILDAWEELKSELDKSSPFYTQIQSRAGSMKENLEKLSPEIFREKTYNRVATRAEFVDYHLYEYAALCWEYQFVRLLRASKQTTKTRKHLKILTRHFQQGFREIDAVVDFSSFKLLPLESLTKCQVGSALIALKDLTQL